MKLIVSLVLLAWSATAGLAFAEGPRAKGSFSCYYAAEFQNAVRDDGSLRINNFSFGERKADRYNSASLFINYAATNRSSTEQWLTADFIVLDGDEEPLAAITAGPPGLKVKAMGAAIGNGFTFVTPGTLVGAVSVCLRIFSMPL